MRLALLLLCACGRLSFDTTTDAGDTQPTLLSISSPAAGAMVGATATLSGTCVSGVAITVSGSGVMPTSTSCNAEQYSVEVTFSDGAGDKVVIVTQGTMSVTRTFVRVASMIAQRSSSIGTQPTQGFNVDCDLVIPRPTTTAGDLLVGVIYTDGGTGASITTPGFTRLMLDSGAYVAFYKIAAIEPDSFAFHIVAGTGGADTCESAGVLVAFDHVAASPIAAESTNVVNSANVLAASVNAPVATLLVGAWGSNGPATGFEGPTGMTINGSRAASQTAGFANAMIAWQYVGAGPTGERGAQLMAPAEAAATLIALKPAP